MADEQARLTLRNALNEFDTPHLRKLSAAAYDRWNWDSNSEADQLWYEVSREILEERGENMSNPNGVNISMNDNNGQSISVLELDSCGDLILGVGTGGSVRVKDATPNFNNIEHEVFKLNGSSDLELGYELKRAIVKFITDEMMFGTTTDSNGKSIQNTLHSEIDMRAPSAVKNML